MQGAVRARTEVLLVAQHLHGQLELRRAVRVELELGALARVSLGVAQYVVQAAHVGVALRDPLLRGCADLREEAGGERLRW